MNMRIRFLSHQLVKRLWMYFGVDNITTVSCSLKFNKLFLKMLNLENSFLKYLHILLFIYVQLLFICIHTVGFFPLVFHLLPINQI